MTPNSGKQRAPAKKTASQASHSRVATACTNCRKRRVKCSGSNPCERCHVHHLDCLFQEDDIRKVTVLESFIANLKRRIRQLEELAPKRSKGLTNYPHIPSLMNPVEGDYQGLLVESSTEPVEVGAPPLGRTVLLQSSSSDSIFAAAMAIINPALTVPENCLVEDMYNDVLSATPEKSLPELFGSLSFERFSRYVVNLLQFLNCGFLQLQPTRLMRRVRAECFTGNRWSYFTPDTFMALCCMVVALGEVYEPENCIHPHHTDSQNASEPLVPPGVSYFQKAIALLPSFILQDDQQGSHTAVLIEAVSLAAIYLRVINKNIAAANFSLRALLLAINRKLLTTSPITSEEDRQQFWAAFTLNRTISLRIGYPLLLHVDEIDTPMPLAPSRAFVPAGLPGTCEAVPGVEAFASYETGIHPCFILLAQISEKISRCVYRRCTAARLEPIGTTTTNTLLSVLSELVQWAEVLPAAFKLEACLTNEPAKASPIDDQQPIPADHTECNRNRRFIYSLHCNYCHCIIISTVPLLIHLAQNQNGISQSALANPNVHKIIHMHLEACSVSLRLYGSLYRGKLITTFGFMDQDYLFCVGLGFVLGQMLWGTGFPIDLARYEVRPRMGQVLTILTNLLRRGNRIAHHRCNQLNALVLLVPGFERFGSAFPSNAAHPAKPDAFMVTPPATAFDAPYSDTLFGDPTPQMISDFYSTMSMDYYNITEGDILFFNEAFHM